MKDELISKQKYSGSLPVYSLSWSKFNNVYGLRIYMNYEDAPGLKNYNITSSVQQTQIGIAFVYPIGSISFFSKNAYLFLGPAVDIFSHKQVLNISNFDVYNASVNAWLYSGCVRAEAYYELKGNIRLHASGQISILSEAFKSTSDEGTQETIVTPLSGFDSQIGIDILYKITKGFTASAGYRFRMAEISKWDYFVAAQDQFTAALSYKF